MPNLTLQPGTLDNPSCFPATPQDLYNEMFAKGVAVQNTTLTGVIKQDAEPAVADRDKVWIRTSGGAPVFPPAWIFYNGQWVARHPVPAGTLWALPYTGSAASIATLDGGAAGAISDNSGPFWEVVASLAARMPIGAGTLPSGTVLAVGDTGGEEKHTLTIAELPSLTIPITGKSNLDINTSSTRTLYGTGAEFTETFQLGPVGSGNSHNTLPPYAALSFLRRTARVFCTQPF